MAVAYQSITNNGAGGATTFSHTTPSGTNRLIVVGVVWYDGTSETISSVTYDGNALTEAVTVNGDGEGGAGGNAAALYYRVGPDEGAANVVVTFSSSPSEGPVIFAASFEGVDQSSPVDDTDTDQGSDPNSSVTVSSQTDGLCVGVVYSYQDATFTSGAGQTRRDTHTYNDDTGGFDTEAGAASVTVSWTNAGYPVSVGAAFAPAAGAGPSIPVLMRAYRNMRQA